jgi:hypothetical protein
MNISKECTDCNEELPLNAFNNASKGKHGKQAICRECQKKHRAKYYEENKETLIAKRMEWRKKNLDRDRAIQKKWIESNPERYKEIWTETNKRYRQKVLEKVADGKKLVCVRCGCDMIECLEINHINGGGAQEVKHKNRVFYKNILDGSRPVTDLELLCRPCNAIHYLELKHGKLPFKIIWGDKDV